MALHVFEHAKLGDDHYRTGMPEFRDVPAPIFHHMFMSVFEETASCLWRLGILRDVGSAAGRGFSFFVFGCNVEDAGAVAERNWSAGPAFDDLLDAFVNLFGDYGIDRWGFSTERHVPFNVDERIAPALDALAGLGYATKADKGYVWTDLIAPTMYRTYSWQPA